MTDSELVRLADAARSNSYAPYSGFSVGAALLCADGTVLSGCNVENASYSVTCCAERSALFAAVSAGKTAVHGARGCGRQTGASTRQFLHTLRCLPSGAGGILRPRFSDSRVGRNRNAAVYAW